MYEIQGTVNSILSNDANTTISISNSNTWDTSKITAIDNSLLDMDYLKDLTSNIKLASTKTTRKVYKSLVSNSDMEDNSVYQEEAFMRCIGNEDITGWTVVKCTKNDTPINEILLTFSLDSGAWIVDGMKFAVRTYGDTIIYLGNDKFYSEFPFDKEDIIDIVDRIIKEEHTAEKNIKEEEVMNWEDYVKINDDLNTFNQKIYYTTDTTISSKFPSGSLVYSQADNSIKYVGDNGTVSSFKVTGATC